MSFPSVPARPDVSDDRAAEAKRRAEANAGATRTSEFFETLITEDESFPVRERDRLKDDEEPTSAAE